MRYATSRSVLWATVLVAVVATMPLILVQRALGFKTHIHIEAKEEG